MAAKNIKEFNEHDVKGFLNSFDTVLTDCDGVLWIDNTPLPNCANVLDIFRSLGKRVFYVTNNSTKTREEFVEKCKMLNFEAKEDDILSTANLSACYLQDLGFKEKVYVIGSNAIAKELEKVGISHCGVGPDPVSKGPYLNFKRDPEVGAVLVGFDEHFSYPKMLKAATYLNDPKIHFIATNTDEKFPGANNVIVPGTGSLVRCIETCAERKATVLGKPGRYVADVLTERYKVKPERTLMIGDRHNTDILLGTRCGFKTLLVLTGVCRFEDIQSWQNSESKEVKEYIPDYYIDALGDLLLHLKPLKPAAYKIAIAKI